MASCTGEGRSDDCSVPTKYCYEKKCYTYADYKAQLGQQPRGHTTGAFVGSELAFSSPSAQRQQRMAEGALSSQATKVASAYGASVDPVVVAAVEAFLEAAAMAAEAEETELSYSFGVWMAADEQARLKERFGSSSTTTELIEEAVSSMASEVASLNMTIEYNFKKIKYRPFHERNLSSFETDESSQGVSVSATKTVSTTTMGGTTSY
jgi:hypothetical protein